MNFVLRPVTIKHRKGCTVVERGGQRARKVRVTSSMSLRALICSSSSVELGAGVRHIRLEITAFKIWHDKFFQFVRLHNKDAWQAATVRPA